MYPHQKFIYYRTYSRFDYTKGRREHWNETVQRYTNFIKNNVDTSKNDLQLIHQSIYALNVMPSMRALWAAGEAANKSHCTMYNCSAHAITSIKSFSATMYLLMCGCGVGFSVENHYISRLPEIKKKTDVHTHIVVEDSREGWAKAFYKLLLAHWEGHTVTYDLSKLRPEGSPLKAMGGRSSGPRPLKELFDFVQRIFDEVRKNNRRKLTSLECLDVLNKTGECVTAGGIRRSAEISLSDLDDSLIAGAKQGQFWNHSPHRALSNNSAVYYGKPEVLKYLSEFTELIKSGAGERGIFNRNAIIKNLPERRKNIEDWLTNPCFHEDTLVHTKNGHFPIKNLVGKTVEIWDGNNWVSCSNFRVTGTKRSLLKITLYDGTEIKVTPYHSFILDNDERVKACELTAGDKLKLSTADSTNGTLNAAGAYAKGVLLADGTHVNNSRPARNSIMKIEPMEGLHTVYCCTVPSTSSFSLSCGIHVGQCTEISLRDKQFCNLSSTVIRPEDSLETILHKVKIATHIGVIQSTFTNFPEDIMGKGWVKNCEEERLLGVSLTGLRGHSILSTSNDKAVEYLKAMKTAALKEAEMRCKQYGINFSAATTCIKPEGTSSQFNNTSSGCHPWYADYFIRRYRISANDPLFLLMKDAGIPYQPEVGQTIDNAYTYVLDFPIAAPPNSITRHTTSALEQLQYALNLKKYWAEHQVSCTVYVKPHEWPAVMAFVYDNFDDICGISFLPEDHVYQLAPYEEITEETYAKLYNSFPEISYENLTKYEGQDNTEGAKTYSCIGDKCDLV